MEGYHQCPHKYSIFLNVDYFVDDKHTLTVKGYTCCALYFKEDQMTYNSLIGEQVLIDGGLTPFSTIVKS